MILFPTPALALSGDGVEVLVRGGFVVGGGVGVLEVLEVGLGRKESVEGIGGGKGREEGDIYLVETKVAGSESCGTGGYFGTGA